jgi:serine/threonine-protein kinase
VKVCPACRREYGDDTTTCVVDSVSLVVLDTGASTSAQDLVGQVVDGRYRLERIVGQGGMGTVYACRHVVVGKEFAIKVLRSGVERSDEVLQRFVREAQAANAVKTRHICETLDFGQLPNGALYVVMELLDGTSLTRALRHESLDRRQLKHVFIQIAETLQKAHDCGIVHRDLKPDNVVLVRDDGDPLFVKLVDFGIAKMLQKDASDLTETGVVLGTPYYMSPEQARGDLVDHRTDIRQAPIRRRYRDGSVDAAPHRAPSAAEPDHRDGHDDGTPDPALPREAAHRSLPVDVGPGGGAAVDPRRSTTVARRRFGPRSPPGHPNPRRASQPARHRG